MKFFLHVSKSEQKKRILERLDDPEKYYKFSAQTWQNGNISTTIEWPMRRPSPLHRRPGRLGM